MKNYYKNTSNSRSTAIELIIGIGINKKGIKILQKFLMFILAFVMVNLFLPNNLFAQIALRGSATTSVQRTTASSITVDKPTGIVEGDVMIANISSYIGSNQTIHATCSGWTEISWSNHGESRGSATLLYKVATSSEGTTYTFSVVTNSTAASGAIIGFSGVNISNPFDVTPSTSFYTEVPTTNVINPITTITSITSNTAVILFGNAARTPVNTNTNQFTVYSVTAPASLTELYDAGNSDGSNNGTAVGAAWANKSGTGSTGNGSITLSFSGGNTTRSQSGILIALRPAKYFRSITSGNWASNSTWEESTDGGSNWVNATNPPNQGDLSVIIQNNHTVTLNAAENAPNLTINSLGSLNTSTFLLSLYGDFVNNGSFTSGNGGVTIAGTATQSIAGFTTTGAVSMIKTAGAATFTGNVSGAGLTINGTGGTLNLGSGLTHTFSGTWTRTAGTLDGGSSKVSFSNTTAYSGTGGTFTASSSTVNYSGSTQSVAPLTYNNLTLSGNGVKTLPTGTTTVNAVLSIENGTNVNTFTGTLVYGASATLQYNAGSSNRTVQGIAAGDEWPPTWANASNGVIIKGTGTITLNGNKSLTNCPITIKGGATLANGGFTIGGTLNALNLEWGALASTLSGSGIVTLGGPVNVTYPAAGTTAASISTPLSLGATRTFTVADDGGGAFLTTNNGLTISSIISGGFGITKAGYGKMLLSGSNSFTGATLVNAGVLNIQNALGTGTTAGGVTVASAARLELEGGITVGAEALSLAGEGGGSSGGALYNKSGDNTWGGTVSLTADTRINSLSGSLTISNSLSMGAFILYLQGASTAANNISGAISGSGQIQKVGSGSWMLSGINSSTGQIYIGAGTIKLGANGTSPNGPLGTTSNNTVVVSDATLDLNGFSIATAEPLFLNGIGVSSGGALVNSSATGVTYSGTITLSSASSIGTTGNIAATGGITGSQNLAKVGNGTLSCGSAAVTLNDLTISAGTLSSTTATMNLSGNFENNSSFTHNNGTVNFNGSSAQQSIGGTSSSTFYNLTLNNGTHGALLSQHQTVNNTLTLTAGNLNIASKILSLGNAATAVAGGTFSSTKMIVADGGGEIRKYGTSTSTASYLFPVGTASGTAKYSPLTLNFNSATYSNAYTSVKVINAKHPNNASAINYLNRYWTLASSGITSFSCNVAATYVTADVSGLEASQKAARYSGSLPWIKYSSLSSNTLTANGVTSFSDFTGINAADPTVSISSNPSLSVCKNAALNLTANASGDPVIAYAWNPGGSTTSTISPSTATVGSTTYTITLTDGNGFTASASASVVVNPLPAVTTTSGDGSFCGTATITADGGAVGTIYYQGTTSGGTSTATASTSQSVSSSGLYYFRSMSSAGCWGDQGTVSVTIQAKQSISGRFDYYNIDGDISLENNVTLGLYTNSNCTTLAATTSSNTQTTTVSATYSFDNVCPATYYIKASSVHSTAGSVNAIDAAQLNYWKVYTPTTPLSIAKVRFYAGDVILNNTLDANDAAEILSHFVNNEDSWPVRDKWSFWLKGASFDQNPISPPSGIQYSGITVSNAPLTNIDFYGLCTGDFNRSYNLTGAKSAEDKLSLERGKILNVNPGNFIELPVYADMDLNLTSFSLILNFPADQMEIKAVYLAQDAAQPLPFNVNGNEVRIGWTALQAISLRKGDPLLTMQLQLKASANGNDIGFMLADNPLNELGDENFKGIPNALLSMDRISTQAKAMLPFSEKISFSNHPNPFDRSTTFEYSLPNDARVSLEIYDLMGKRTILALDENKTAGAYSFVLEATALKTGMYTACLTISNKDQLIRRCIKIISK